MVRWKRWLLCAILATLSPPSFPFCSPPLSADPILTTKPGSPSSASFFSPVARVSDFQLPASFPQSLCSQFVTPLSLRDRVRERPARDRVPGRMSFSPVCLMAASDFSKEAEGEEGMCKGRTKQEGWRRENMEEVFRDMHLRDGTRVYLRAVTEKDSTEVLELLGEVVSNGTSLPYLTLADASKHLQSHVCMVAHTHNQTLLGYFWLGPAFPGRSTHLASLTLITHKLHRRRGVASLMAIAAMRLAPSLGYDALFAPLIFVSDSAAVALHRSLHFKLLSIIPRAAKLDDGRKATDAMQFWYNLNRPTLPAPSLRWLLKWHPAHSNSRAAAPPGVEEAGGEETRGESVEEEEERGAVGEEEWAEHRRWMREAVSRADIAEDLGEVPIGAVVVRGGEIVGEGWNHAISGNDPCGHAEIAAIRDAANTVGNYRLAGCSLYVTLEPCVMCAGAAVHARLSSVVFASRDTKAGAAGSVHDVFANPSVNHEVKVVAGVREVECSERLSVFFSRRRRTSAQAKGGADKESKGEGRGRGPKVEESIKERMQVRTEDSV